MKFVPVQNFDSLAPTTTKGDVIVRGASGNTRLAVGSDNTVLTADSSQALGVKWASATANIPVNTLTGATTLPATSQNLLVSGTTFAITLPSPASNSGLVYYIKKTDGIPTPISITGTGFKGMTLSTQGEEISILCDGSTFWDFNHYASTGWTLAGGVSFSATTTAPTKGASVITDQTYWRRQGDSMEVRMAYRQVTGGTAGVGDYLFNLPGGAQVAIDTNKVKAGPTTGYGANNNWLIDSDIGQGSYSIGTGSNTGAGAGPVFVHNTTTVRLAAVANAADGVIGGAFAGIDFASANYVLKFKVPIVGWSE